MKKLLLVSTLICLSTLLWSQSLDLPTYNQDRLNRQKTGMLILGGWAAVNIAGGLALASNREGSDKYFHLMNAGWNGVNLAIAGFGYYNALHTDPASFDLYMTINEQHKFQKVLLFNAGLDIGYMAGGLYLLEKSKTSTSKTDQLNGFGRSIILQGAFLFAFDLANYFVHARHNSALDPLLSSLYFTGSEAGLVFAF